MKKVALFTMVFALVAVLSACGDTKENSSSQASQTDTKQTEIEAENQKLKEEAEALKKELAEKEASEVETAATEVSKETQEPETKSAVTAEMMSLVVPNLVEGGAVDQKTYDYLVKNADLFPAVTAETKKAATKEVDSKITSKHLFKNITPYLDKMVKVTGTVVQVQEEETDFGTVASIHIMDESGNSLIGYYNNSTGDILDGDDVTMRGVPTAVYSFDNISGGTTNAIMLAVSTVQKVQ
ncbi:hypothetical protein DC345_18020 [Paenibacillus taichungensis]|uniref:Uncharacterized protein n=1 Tax=Paenibacillus taichungensis TaxID=484184 RepID=A0A329QNE8_9BACL|nr:hypothetical protein [Paenibacillus taichungensis]RAW13686.1 hypothetical protein DC345_18020 [Paenibacillus taichungensis]